MKSKNQKLIKAASMAKKLLIITMFFSPFFFSCGNGEEERNPVVDSLTNVTKDLSGQVTEKEKAITDMIGQFNEIEDNLDVIKEKEKILSVSTKDGELAKSQKDQIVEDIQAIYDLMAKNKNKLAAMNKKLKNANIKISELETMITRLTAQLEEKETTINDLKNQLEKMNLELSDITAKYEEETKVSEEKTEKLNTAFYAFGTSKELIKQGVLTKEGGFIGIGKAEKLKSDFNKNYFTKIDVSAMGSIPLGCKKAKLVTTHSAGSYKFEGEQGKKIEKLTITSPDEFWSASKYCVIVIE